MYASPRHDQAKQPTKVRPPARGRRFQAAAVANNPTRPMGYWSLSPLPPVALRRQSILMYDVATLLTSFSTRRSLTGG